ncbi:MAG: hypothetical protein MZW92_81895 [Comamonadaceae bacterium]|nr:hypothetical protein [Comamonadaceae bacterium]
MHHGDGVFYEYEDDPDLIIVDIHEDGRFLYPGTGHASERSRGAAEGSKLNLPLPPGRPTPSSCARGRRRRSSCATVARSSSSCSAAPTACRATRWPTRR